MHKRKASITLIAIAVMAIAATSAFAYYETWGGWWSSGLIRYNGNNYTITSGGGRVKDSTVSTRDTFYIDSTYAIPFVRSSLNDTIYFTPSMSISQTTGGKKTGQITDNNASGSWSGSGHIVSASQNFTMWGTWSGRFTYGIGTPTYTASAVFLGTNPGNLFSVVGASSSGSRIYYSP